MIRITGGQFRGRQVACPRGRTVRPTTAFVRESLFSILGPRIQGARFLDLFAGCGIVGFEALSRGAHHVVAVDKSSAQCRLLAQNRERLHLSEAVYQWVASEALAWLQSPPEAPFDLIFLDPPYDQPETAAAVIQACFTHHRLAPGGLLVYEHSAKTPPSGFPVQPIETRFYGESALSFFEGGDASEKGA